MREVARRLGISEKTVEKQIAKAMLRCRQALRATGRLP
jgi:RNA polymerase sigma-70 factor (ECF subfamily)